jgi:hypothetical protein
MIPIQKHLRKAKTILKEDASKYTLETTSYIDIIFKEEFLHSLKFWLSQHY